MRCTFVEHAFVRYAFGACVALAGACGGAPTATSAASEIDAGGADAADEASCAALTLDDPGLASTAAWTPTLGATLAPGAATFDAAAICGLAGIAQALPASPLVCARPLVLSFDAALGDDDKVSFAVGVGGGWNLPALAFGPQTVSVCLGASVFGAGPAPRALFLGPGTNPSVCPPPDDGGPTIVLSRVSLAADVQGACPLPGTVPNGDFERAAGWTLRPGSGVAEIAAGLGEGGSAAAHLAGAHPCDQPALRGAISLPTAAMVPNPALRVWSKGSAGAVVSIRIGSLLPTYYTGATYLPGRDEAVSSNVCVPTWAEGTVQPLELALVSTRLTEECVTDEPRDFVLDGLGFVSEPACASGAPLSDGGFEQALEAPGLAPFWAFERYDDEPTSDVALSTDGATAHTGMAGARFSASSPCPRASLSGAVTLPAPVGAAGPALHLWYETNTGTHGALAVSMNALSLPVALPPTADWTRATICLDPRLAGRPEILRITLTNASGGGTCADTFPEETVGVDDVDLGTDPTCPVM